MRPSRIMVVDASEVSRSLITRILNLELEGSRIVACESANEALAYLDREQFDLVTTGLMLRDMDGLELCRHIRGSERHRYTPVVVVSADADTRLLREGFASGVTDYFDKTRGYHRFVEFIKGFTRRRTGLVGRVLYVEDSPTAAEAHIGLMEKHGLRVIHTTNAEDALRHLEHSVHGGEEPVDVVITDFFLVGVLTGGDLLHAIRSRLRLSQQDLPVLVVTGHDNESRQIEAFHAGANDYITKPFREEILMARLRTLLLIKQQYDALKRQAEEMRALAATDSLTGLRSRRYLLEHGEPLFSEAANRPLSVIVFDVDRFKLVNDTLGHATGDHVLADLGGLFAGSFPSGSLIARLGGDEIVVVLPRCDAAQARAMAEVARRSAEQQRPGDVDTTVSGGIASTADHPSLSLAAVLELADKALLEAKGRGRNRLCVHGAREIE